MKWKWVMMVAVLVSSTLGMYLGSPHDDVNSLLTDSEMRNTFGGACNEGCFPSLTLTCDDAFDGCGSDCGGMAWSTCRQSQLVCTTSSGSFCTSFSTICTGTYTMYNCKPPASGVLPCDFADPARLSCHGTKPWCF